MFEKEAEERITEQFGTSGEYVTRQRIWQDGAEFGYNKANEWHKVIDGLPEMDKLVYFWSRTDDFPVVARRHIFYGHKEWSWDCKWGSGYTVSQSAGKDYLWKEIVLPKESE